MLIKGLRFSAWTYFSLSCIALAAVIALFDASEHAMVLRTIAGLSGLVALALIVLSARPRRANPSAENT